MRGRQKTLKLIKGKCPSPLTEIPEPPTHLAAIAAEEWRRVAPILREMQALTEADLVALEQRCASYAVWRESESKLAEFGQVIASPSGFAQPSPWGAIARQALDRILKFDREFGLTPRSRQQMRLAKPQTTDAELDRRKREFLEKANRGA